MPPPGRGRGRGRGRGGPPRGGPPGGPHVVVRVGGPGPRWRRGPRPRPRWRRHHAGPDRCCNCICYTLQCLLCCGLCWLCRCGCYEDEGPPPPRDEARPLVTK